ncbi:Aldehyde/histidinol dehydrogenase [Hypoxylon sp. NC0597]|nr:Aldehyde/histidinol dehydrogenase [Hypoxylon sp. NC0597]
MFVIPYPKGGAVEYDEKYKRRLTRKVDIRLVHLCAFIYLVSQLPRPVKYRNGKFLNQETGDSFLQKTNMTSTGYSIMLTIFKSIRAALKGSSIPREEALIGGQWVVSSSTFPVYDPATNRIIANVPNLTNKDFTTAVEHANEAFTAFKNTQETDRPSVLHKWAPLVCQHAKDLGVILTMKNGKTLAEGEGEVEYGASFITWLVEEARRGGSYGDMIPSRHKGSTNIVLRQPVGMCGIIAPALAAGCTVVVKHQAKHRSVL